MAGLLDMLLGGNTTSGTGINNNEDYLSRLRYANASTSQNAVTPNTVGTATDTGSSLAGMLGGIGDFTTKYADGINAISGLGGLGFGLANYLQARDMYDKQMRAMDQQYAFNEAAKANKENIASDFRTSLAG